MFEKLIQLLNSGKTFTQYELSEQRGISPETLQSYIEYLHRKGLLSQIALEADNTTCSGSCSRRTVSLHYETIFCSNACFVGDKG